MRGMNQSPTSPAAVFNELAKAENDVRSAQCVLNEKQRDAEFIRDALKKELPVGKMSPVRVKSIGNGLAAVHVYCECPMHDGPPRETLHIIALE